MLCWTASTFCESACLYLVKETITAMSYWPCLQCSYHWWLCTKDNWQKRLIRIHCRKIKTFITGYFLGRKIVCFGIMNNIMTAYLPQFLFFRQHHIKGLIRLPREQSSWGPPGSCQPQMGPMLAPWTLLSGWFWRGLLSPCRKSSPEAVRTRVLFAQPWVHWDNKNRSVLIMIRTWLFKFHPMNVIIYSPLKRRICCSKRVFLHASPIVMSYVTP